MSKKTKTGTENTSLYALIVSVLAEKATDYNLPVDEQIKLGYFFRNHERGFEERNNFAAELNELKGWLANELILFADRTAEDMVDRLNIRDNVNAEGADARHPQSLADDIDPHPYLDRVRWAEMLLNKYAETDAGASHWLRLYGAGANKECNNKLSDKEHRAALGMVSRLAKAISDIREAHKTQGIKGNWDVSPYMTGLYNGIEYCVSILDNRDVQYKDIQQPDPTYSALERERTTTVGTRTGRQIVEEAYNAEKARAEREAKASAAPCGARGEDTNNIQRATKDETQAYSAGFVDGNKDKLEYGNAREEDGFKRGYEQHKRDIATEQASEGYHRNKKLDTLERLIERIGKRSVIRYRTTEEDRELGIEGFPTFSAMPDGDLPRITVRRVNSVELVIIPIRSIVDIAAA